MTSGLPVLQKYLLFLATFCSPVGVVFKEMCYDILVLSTKSTCLMLASACPSFMFHIEDFLLLCHFCIRPWLLNLQECHTSMVLSQNLASVTFDYQNNTIVKIYMYMYVHLNLKHLEKQVSGPQNLMLFCETSIEISII